jgi:hypothetical protein
VLGLYRLQVRTVAVAIAVIARSCSFLFSFYLYPPSCLSSMECLVLNELGNVFWEDMWNSGIPANQYPELFSFACNSKLTVKEALQKEQLIEIFQLPLSVQAHEQFLDLDATWGQVGASS